MSEPCRLWLAGQQPQGRQEAPPQQGMQVCSNQQQQQCVPKAPPPVVLPTALLQQLIDGLLPAVRGGEAQGTLHARKLSTALMYTGGCTRVRWCECTWARMPQRITRSPCGLLLEDAGTGLICTRLC